MLVPDGVELCVPVLDPDEPEPIDDPDEPIPELEPDEPEPVVEPELPGVVVLGLPSVEPVPAPLDPGVL